MTSTAAHLQSTTTRDCAHPTCFVCAPAPTGGLRLQFTRDPDGSVHGIFGCDNTYQGYPGLVHGGIVASVLDGAMTNCLFEQGEIALTADLHVRFRFPVHVGQPAMVRAWVTRSCAPLFVVTAELAQGGEVKATAVGKFMRR
jgi:acyl-coenzyme A thioesterase PaaI-like protein